MSIVAVTRLSVKLKAYNQFDLSWVIPKNAFNSRYEQGYGNVDGISLYVNYTYVTSKGRVTSKRKLVKSWDSGEYNLPSITSCTLNGTALGYPQNSEKVTSYYFTIQTGGLEVIKGEYRDGKWYAKKTKAVAAETTVAYSFEAPSVPTISSSFNASTGILTFRVKTDSGNKLWYDTRFRITRTDSSNRNNTYKTEKAVVPWTTKTSTDFTTTYDVSDHQTIAQNQWIKIKCEAYSRGICGDSKTTSKTYMIAHPAAATISGISATSAPNGIVTVKVATNSTNTRPVTSVKLQRLYNTTIGTAASAAAALGWEDVSGAVDNATCSGFTDQKSDAMPEVRKHTWYRVVSTYGANSVEGWPVEAKCLYRLRDAASADAIKWRKVAIGEDGASVELAMGWATDNYTAVQVAWADNPDAWESSEQPKMQVMDWEDATPASGYTHSGRFVIRGLEAGKPVYVRARRVKVEEDRVTVKGEWCSPPSQYYPLDVASDPDSVTLFVPELVARTEGIDCQWEYGGAEMTSWALYRVAGSTLKVLMSGNGSANRCTIEPAKLSGLDSAILRLGVTSGAGWLYSDDAPVTISDAPGLEVSAPETLIAQPGSIGLSCSVGGADVRLAIKALGSFGGGGPDGREPEQMNGDIVWSTALSPDWETEGDGFSATVDMPSGLAFVDGARYLVTASATDPATGLSSGEASAEMAVEWAHQAVEPSDESTVTVDADALTATITPVAPTGAAETDVCDVYRVTPHAVTPVIRGAAFGDPVLDPYAPFSSEEGAEVSYRLCTRTADGDEAWMDVACPLSHKSIVVDWPGGSLSLPYEITKTDRWDTLFSLSTRWDKAKVGHWLASGRHSVRVESRLLRGEDMGKVPLISALAAYSGSCFARFPDGTAFECDVSPSETSISVGSGSVPASFDITEVDPTDAYLGAPAEEEEEEPDA